MASNLKVKIVLDADGKVAYKVLDEAGKKVQSLGGNLDTAAGKSRNFGEVSESSAKKTGLFGASLHTLARYASGLSFFSAIKSAISATDQYNSFAAQLRVTTASTQDFNFAQSEVFAIAQRTGAELGATTTTFARLNSAIGDMGGSVQLTANITETLNNALKINRASTAEAQSAQLQFSQAIGSGVLRGEEFNALMENATPLMRGLADQLNVNVGELRNMAQAGELTADVVVPAMAAISAEMKEQADAMGTTLPQAWTKMQNASTKWAGESTALQNITSALSAGVEYVADNMNLFADAATRLGVVLAAHGSIKLLAMTGALSKVSAGYSAASLAAARYTLVMTGSLKASNFMIKSTKLLGLAFKSAFGILIAYEIGKWAYDNFGKVRIAWLATQTAFKNGWERIKAGFAIGGAAIKAYFKGAFNFVKEAFADVVQVVANGMDGLAGLLNKIGITAFDGITDGLKDVVDTIRPTESAWDELKDTTTKAIDDMNDAISFNNAEVKGLIDAEKDAIRIKKEAAEKTDDQAKSADDLAKELASLSSATKTSTALTKDQEKALKDATAATQQQEAAYRNLLRELNPAQAASDDYASKLAILENQFTGAARESDEFRQRVLDLDAQFLGFNETIKETGDKADESPSKVATAWEDGMKRVDSSFAEAFKNGFRDMKSFGRNIIGSLKDTLAEMAWQWTKSKFFQLLTKFGKGDGILSGVSKLAGSVLGQGGLSGGGGLTGLLGAGAGGLGLAAAGVGAAYGVHNMVTDKYGAQSGRNMAAGTVLGASLGGAMGLGAAFVAPLGAAIGTFAYGDWKTKADRLSIGVQGGELTTSRSVHQERYKNLKKRHRNFNEDIGVGFQAEMDAAFDSIISSAVGLAKEFDHSGSRISNNLKSINFDLKEIRIDGKTPEELSAAVNAFISSMAGDVLSAVVPEMSGAIRLAGDRAGELIKPLIDISNYAGEVWQPQLKQSFDDINSGTAQTALSIIASHDGSIESANLMAAAVSERAVIEQNMLQSILAAEGNIESMVGNTAERLQRMQETEQQYVDRLGEQTQSAIASLSLAEDASAVNELMSQITSNINAVTGLATEEQRTAVAKQMTGVLSAADDAATARLEQFKTTVESSHNAIADAALEAITAGSGDAAKATIDAAKAQIDAGSKLLTAANKQDVAADNLSFAAQQMAIAAGNLSTKPAQVNVRNYYNYETV